jgi:hypothetical protein
MIVDKGKMPKNPTLSINGVGTKALLLCYYGQAKCASVQDLATGNGFATFCEFAAFLLALSAAIIISPWMTGTPQEKAILRSPKTYLNN